MSGFLHPLVTNKPSERILQVTTQKQQQAAKVPFSSRPDIYQHVTDTIITQLEKGTAPWHKPWLGGDINPFRLPINQKTGKTYQGINIILLWCASINKEFTCNDWGTFKQWSEKKESIRKGEKGSMVVYYDTFEKDVDGEIKNVPFLKQSVVFNRCQLASFQAEQIAENDTTPLVERLDNVENFVANTKAVVKHTGYKACFVPSKDEIYMPGKNTFINSEGFTATEAYYSTLLHELTHWSGHTSRLDRKQSRKFADIPYAEEELIAELGAAFLCANLEITNAPKPEHANYIAHWLKVLKQNKYAIISAASSASKAVDYLHSFQPTK